MTKSFVSKIKFRHILYFFALIAGWPCVFGLMGWLPDFKLCYMALAAVLGAICLSKGALKMPQTITNLIFIQCVTWGIYSLIHSDTAYYTRIFYLVIVYMLLALMYHYRETIRYVKIFNGWILLQAVLGTIGVLLVLMNILHPFFEFEQMDGRTGYFFGLFTTKAYLGGLVRNAGFFDEPGALANWGVIALLMNKIFLDDKLVERLLVIGLVSTFSMAYFIQVSLYLLLFNTKKKGGGFYALIAFVLFFCVLTFFASFNEDINRAIFGRFQMDNTTGKLAGDNRTALTEVTLAYFLQAPIFGHGASGLIALSQHSGEFVGGNPFSLLAADGIVGYGISLLPFIFILVKNRYKNKEILFAWLIILAGFFQRPYDGTQLLYPLLIYLFLQTELLYNRTGFYTALDKNIIIGKQTH